MALYYDEATRQWYDPRAPMVGRYAKTNVTGKRRGATGGAGSGGPPTVYIHNLYSSYAGRVAQKSAASLGRR